ncbi:MAG: glycosyltransferase 87 family protein [Solirubrobacterales bacterium]
MATQDRHPARARPVTAARRETFQRWLPAMALAVAAISVWSAWADSRWQAIGGGDYSKDYAPSMNALLDGHLGAFFANLPTNGAGGSVLLRAPFAGLGKILAGDQLAIFRFGTLACLLALGAVGLWLAREMRRRGTPPATCVGVIALYACTPALLEAVFYGHPEEPLGAALAIAAVLLAGADRPLLAGVLLGAAVINKPWGVLAIGPVLLCAPERWRRVLLPSGAILGVWLLSSALVAPVRLLLSVHGAETSIVAHPQDLWWPLAHTVGLYTLPPAILSAHARQLAVVLALATAAALALRTRRSHTPVGVERCLALLAFGFALRCLLEPSPHDYYLLPFVVALAAWEVRARGSVAVSLTAAILLALDFRRLEEVTATVPFLVYLAVMFPVCALLLASMFGSSADRSSPGKIARRRAGHVDGLSGGFA